MRSRKASSSGFTLVELMIVIVIVAVLLTLAVPGMSNFFDTQQLKSAGEQIYSDIQLARSEAIARKSLIRVNVSADGSTIWTYAISNVDNCDLTVTDPNEPNACTLIVDDGDLSVHGIDGAVDFADKILQLRPSTEHGNVAMARNGFQNGTQITFEPSSGTAIGNSGNLLLTSPKGKRILVKVSPLGQVRLCSPDDSVLGYVDGDTGDDTDC